MVNKGLLFPRNVDGVISSAYSLELSADETFADEPDFANERPMVKTPRSTSTPNVWRLDPSMPSVHRE